MRRRRRRRRRGRRGRGLRVGRAGVDVGSGWSVYFLSVLPDHISGLGFLAVHLDEEASLE